MNIAISNSGETPIYEQIAGQITAMIVTGELREGDMLPSMRVLAKDLRISVITTKRAYEELERAGFIVSITGRGSFVSAANLELIREQRLREIEGHLIAASDIAKQCGIGIETLREMLETIYHED